MPLLNEEELKKLTRLSKNKNGGWNNSAVHNLIKAYKLQIKLLNISLEALEFYADPQTYFAITFTPDPPNGDFMKDISECKDEYGDWTKPGKRAREAIAESISLLQED